MLGESESVWSGFRYGRRYRRVADFQRTAQASIAGALFYYDQRIHFEGSDIAWITNDAQTSTPVLAWTEEADLAGVPLGESEG